MRILVVSKFYPPVIGGVEVTVKELCEEFSKQGHAVTAAVMTEGRRSDETLDGVRVLRFPVDTKLLAGLNRNIHRYLAKELRSGRWDVVHVHNFHILLSFQTAMMCRLRGVPYVFSPHYHGRGHTALRNLLFQAYKPVGGIGLAGAKALTFASEHERQRLLADFPRLKEMSVVISPGIAMRRAEGVEREKDSLLFVGRLMSYKGLDHVLNAIRVLGDGGRRVRLRVVGTGPDEKELRALVSELGLGGRVEFLGEVSEDALTEEYARAACLVLLSSAEAYGLVVAEALAMGTPCIVAKAAALSEFTAEPGCFGIDRPEDAVEVAGLIARVLDEGDRVKVGPFSQKISYWPEVAKFYLEVYEKIIA